VVEPVKKVRAGLYTFSFAAPAGSGGTTAMVEVFLDGQSLGERTLPVGLDAWSAGRGVKPVGGCSCALAGDTRTPPRSAWPLMVLACALLLRRREPSARHFSG
jgi:MYXO-CTERM domain-containing protein